MLLVQDSAICGQSGVGGKEEEEKGKRRNRMSTY